MAKAIEKLKQTLQNLHWLTRRGGLCKSVNHTNSRIEHLERSLSRLQRSIDELHLIERSRCYAFGHQMQVDPNDHVITTHLTERGWFEPFETKLVQETVQPGQIVFDIGANIGYYTVQFAKLVGPKGHVYAFEPDPRNFRLLCKNVAQNGYANVTVIQKAISNETCTIKLFRNPSNFGDHRVYQTGESRDEISVQSITLDEFVEQIDTPVDLIKFDIQGAEAFAFDGMQKLLDENRSLKIITEFWPRGLTLSGNDPRAFLENLLERGFEVKVIDEEHETLDSLDVDRLLKKYPIEYDTDIYFTNLFCSRAA